MSNLSKSLIELDFIISTDLDNFSMGDIEIDFESEKWIISSDENEIIFTVDLEPNITFTCHCPFITDSVNELRSLLRQNSAFLIKKFGTTFKVNYLDFISATD